MMTAASIRRMFAPGQTVTVTNHYITKAMDASIYGKKDHPCYGTKVRTVSRVTSSHLWFTETGNVPWPKAEHLKAEHGVVTFWGYPHTSDLFLTIDTRTS